MTVKEVLENFVELSHIRCVGEIDYFERDVIDYLNGLFDEDGSSFTYTGDDDIEIIKLYYKYGLSAEKIGELLFMDKRTVYRKRDKYIDKLEMLFSKAATMPPE